MRLDPKTVLTRGMTFAAGAGVAVAANTLLLNSLNNFYMRNGARFAGAIASAAFLKGDLGGAAAGAMLYPLMQELAAKFLSPATSATEADMEALAADLEDVIGDMDESDLSDDDLGVDLNDDLDNILS